VQLLTGTAVFADPHRLRIVDELGRESYVTADRVIIAAGTRPARPETVHFDDRTIVDSDGIISLERVPRSMVVVGAGVIGIEYASMFAALGTKVTVVERRERMLEFCDVEIVEALKYTCGTWPSRSGSPRRWPRSSGTSGAPWRCSTAASGSRPTP
jgi:NAD(P) transhydrogenase